MNIKLTDAEERELRDHFNLKVRPRYQERTINKIVDAVNKVRCGLMKDTEFVNQDTKIVDWQTYFEVWNLYPKFVQL